MICSFGWAESPWVVADLFRPRLETSRREPTRFRQSRRGELPNLAGTDMDLGQRRRGLRRSIAELRRRRARRGDCGGETTTRAADQRRQDDRALLHDGHAQATLLDESHRSLRSRGSNCTDVSKAGALTCSIGQHSMFDIEALWP